MIRKGRKICPFCGGELQKRGSVKRKLRLGDGDVIVIRIRRYSCKQCGRWHRELPSDLTPYKQYPSTIIEKFNSGKLDDASFGFENYPCTMTQKRWKSNKSPTRR